MGLKQVLGGMGDVEERWLSLRKTINEKLGVKLRPLDMREFFDEVIYSGRSRDIVKRIDVERSY
jgi:hypothetical protein